MQTSFAFLALMQAPKPATDADIARVMAQPEPEAAAVAVSLIGFKQAWVAAQLGISETYLSLIKTGDRPLPERLVIPLCYLTGTLLVKQVRDFREAVAAINGRTACAIASIAANLRRAAA